MSVEAVLFDLDGVLIDSEHHWEAARRDVVATFGGRYDARAVLDVMGMSAPEWSRYMRERLAVPLGDARIGEEVVARVAAAYRRASPVFPGSARAVRALAARVPLAVASSSNRSLIELALELAGLRSAFAVVVSAEEVVRGKPSPEVYLRAAELLGVEPRRCGAVEDSTNGIRAAHAAGTFVVAVPNAAFPPSPDALALASAVAASIDDVTPAVFGLD